MAPRARRPLPFPVPVTSSALLLLLFLALSAFLPCSHSGRLIRDQSLGLRTREHATSASSSVPERRLQVLQIESRNCSGAIFACQTSPLPDADCTNECYQLCPSVMTTDDPFPRVVICNFPQECNNGTCVKGF